MRNIMIIIKILRRVDHSQVGLYYAPVNMYHEGVLSVNKVCFKYHYSDIIMGPMASQITTLTTVFTQRFIQAETKENIKAQRHWPLWGEFTGDWRIHRTKGHWHGKCFHLKTSSCIGKVHSRIWQWCNWIVYQTLDEYRMCFRWCQSLNICPVHDDVIKSKHFPRYRSFVRGIHRGGIHRSPVNSPHKGQWRGALMFSWICVWINDWVNNREAGDLRRYRAHYDVTVIFNWSAVFCYIMLVKPYLEIYSIGLSMFLFCFSFKQHTHSRVTWSTIAY